jgi:lysophospholipid acyltransferase (LPLAT)-like uncharacterized protein
MKEKILAHLLHRFIHLYFSLVNYKFEFEDQHDKNLFFSTLNNTSRQPVILAFFHQDEVAMVPRYTNSGFYVMVSKSNDGEIMSTLASLLGMKTVRGSSSHRAIASFIELLKIAKQGKNVAFAVDGPKGPIFKVKKGIIELHKKTQHPIIPLRAVPKKFYLFSRAWNQARLPLPFSTVIVKIGKIGSYDELSLESKLNSLSA